MVAWLPMARRAVRAAPVALQFARELDRQVRPHLLAYRLAQDVDGYVGRWTGAEGRHWIVFARPDDAPMRSFPPLPAEEVALVERELDRATLRHHSELPEARIKQQGGALSSAPGRVAGRLRRGERPADPLDVPEGPGSPGDRDVQDPPAPDVGNGDMPAAPPAPPRLPDTRRPDDG